MNAYDNVQMHQLSKQLLAAHESVETYKRQATTFEQATGSAQNTRLQHSLMERQVRTHTQMLHKFEHMGPIENFLSYQLCRGSSKGQAMKTERLAQLQQDKQALEEKLAVLAAQLHQAEHVATDFQHSNASLQAAQQTFDRLYAEKKNRMMAEGPDHIKLSLHASIQTNLELERQTGLLDGAVSSGKAALTSLKRVITQLESAEMWGTADMFGGGALATYEKRSRIAEAQGFASVAKQHMSHFNSQVSSVVQRLGSDLDEMNGFAHFADYFFDGFFVDWFVQSQIRQANASCQRAITQVSTIVQDLEPRLAKASRELAKCKREQLELVLSFGSSETRL